MGKGNSGSRANANNHANQMNSNNSAYHSSRSGGASGKAARDNHSDQMNPNNSKYNGSRKTHSFSGGGLFSTNDESHTVSRVQSYDKGFVQKHKRTILLSAGVSALGLLLSSRKK